MNKTVNDTRLSAHFKLSEFLNIEKYPDNKPSMQDVVNMTYGCLMLLEPARQVVGPILIKRQVPDGKPAVLYVTVL